MDVLVHYNFQLTWLVLLSLLELISQNPASPPTHMTANFRSQGIWYDLFSQCPAYFDFQFGVYVNMKNCIIEEQENLTIYMA